MRVAFSSRSRIALKQTVAHADADADVDFNTVFASGPVIIQPMQTSVRILDAHIIAQSAVYEFRGQTTTTYSSVRAIPASFKTPH